MPPRPKKPSSKIPNALLEAIAFLACVGKEKGTVYETHILINNKYAVAYNDIIAAGVIINEEIYAAPNTKIFNQALTKANGEGFSLTIDGIKIVLKAGKFKASIPCIDPTLLAPRLPDPPCAGIDDSLRAAFECMDIIKPEPDAQDVHLLAFLLNGKSVVSTDGRILIEYWHGIDLPTNIAIPKVLIPIILANKKKLYSFGFSPSSVTFYFEDNSWIKSQLYAKQWPMENMENILNRNCNVQPINPDFYKALDAISSFSDAGKVYFKTDLLCSHNTPDTGATHEVTGLHSGPVYSAKYLSIVRQYIEQVDFYTTANGVVSKEGAKGYMCYFFGKNVRGVIAGHG